MDQRHRREDELDRRQRGLSLCCTDITRYKRRENLQDPHDGEEKA